MILYPLIAIDNDWILPKLDNSTRANITEASKNLNCRVMIVNYAGIDAK